MATKREYVQEYVHLPRHHQPPQQTRPCRPASSSATHFNHKTNKGTHQEDTLTSPATTSAPSSSSL